eukprot:2713931-Pleurochrysis_carterae.AAC.2
MKSSCSAARRPWEPRSATRGAAHTAPLLSPPPSAPRVVHEFPGRSPQASVIPLPAPSSTESNSIIIAELQH